MLEGYGLQAPNRFGPGGRAGVLRARPFSLLSVRAARGFKATRIELYLGGEHPLPGVPDARSV